MEKLKQLLGFLWQKYIDFALEHIGLVLFLSALELAITFLVVCLLISARVRNWFFELFLLSFALDTALFIMLVAVRILGIL